MSTREQLQQRLAEWIGTWQTAPYGVLTGIHARQDGPGKYRSITFGLARTLDAELMIWSEKRLDLRSSRHQNMVQTFASEDAFKAFCVKEFGATVWTPQGEVR